MNYEEIPIIFDCAGSRLVGIVAKPQDSLPTGVLIVVGGPQYRSGSHRQFTLLARHLAQNGYPSCRFDYRGMGDSEGAMRNFETVDDDLKAAVDAFMATANQVKQVVIWALCDAASAALYYAQNDHRVKGMVLLNPWAHTEAGEGRSRIKHYYLARLFQKSFWFKIFSGQFEFATSATGLFKAARFLIGENTLPASKISGQVTTQVESYIDRMLTGLKLYTGNVLIILSEKDLVSQEFRELVRADKAWRTTCQPPKVEQTLVHGANHTFSSRIWREQAACLTSDWLQKKTSEWQQ